MCPPCPQGSAARPARAGHAFSPRARTYRRRSLGLDGAAPLLTGSSPLAWLCFFHLLTSPGGQVGSAALEEECARRARRAARPDLRALGTRSARAACEDLPSPSWLCSLRVHCWRSRGSVGMARAASSRSRSTVASSARACFFLFLFAACLGAALLLPLTCPLRSPWPGSAACL